MTRFGMYSLNITQGRYSSFSHSGVNAVDIAGNDSGINNFYAHQDYKITQKFTGEYGNGFAFQSVNKMKFKDGSSDYLTLLMWHDNYINDLTIGQVIKSGSIMFSEGTSGYATGNHIHLECGKGHQHISSLPPDYGMHIPHWTNIENVFYLVEDTVIINDGGYNWTMENTTKYYFKVLAAVDSDAVKNYKCRALRNKKGKVKFTLECVNDTYIFKTAQMTSNYGTVNNWGSAEYQKDVVESTGKTYTTVKEGYKYLVHQIIWQGTPDGYAYVAYKKYK